jgi:hypothetical protein
MRATNRLWIDKEIGLKKLLSLYCNPFWVCNQSRRIQETMSPTKVGWCQQLEWLNILLSQTTNMATMTSIMHTINRVKSCTYHGPTLRSQYIFWNSVIGFVIFDNHLSLCKCWNNNKSHKQEHIQSIVFIYFILKFWASYHNCWRDQWNLIQFGRSTRSYFLSFYFCEYLYSVGVDYNYRTTRKYNSKTCRDHNVWWVLNTLINIYILLPNVPCMNPSHHLNIFASVQQGGRIKITKRCVLFTWNKSSSVKLH